MDDKKALEEKKQKAIGITLGVIIVLIATIGASFAFWTLTASQSDTNKIKSSCLSLSLASSGDAITLEEQMPIRDSEGKKLTGYTFTVTNNCDKDVAYQIGLETFDESGVTELSASSLKVLIDTNRPILYSDLDTIDNVEVSGKTPIANKKLATSTVTANGTNTHTLKLWVDSASTIADADATVSSKINISAGQGITDDQPIRKLLKTIDVSKTAGTDNVVAYYYEDGELTFSGTGEMADDTSQLVLKSLYVNNSDLGFTEEEKALFESEDSNLLMSSYTILLYGLASDEYKASEFGDSTLKDEINNSTEISDSNKSLLLSICDKVENADLTGIDDLNIEYGITDLANGSLTMLFVNSYNVAGSVEILEETPTYFASINLEEGTKKLTNELFNVGRGKNQELVVPKSVTEIDSSAWTEAGFSSVKFNKNSKITSLHIINFENRLTKLYIPESVTSFTIYFFTHDGADDTLPVGDTAIKANMTIYLYGPERTIEGFTPSEYKQVIWNYTD